MILFCRSTVEMQEQISLYEQFVRADVRMTVLSSVCPAREPDRLIRAPMVAGEAMLAVVPPDRLVVLHPDIADRTDFFAKTAAATLVVDRKLLIHFRERSHRRLERQSEEPAFNQRIGDGIRFPIFYVGDDPVNLPIRRVDFRCLFFFRLQFPERYIVRRHPNHLRGIESQSSVR